MKRLVLLCAAIMSASPAAAAAPANPVMAESKLTHSSVSLVVEPQLNDGRLVIRIAAKNGTAAAVPYGPSSISIAKPTGEAIALNSLQQLVDDVRMAAGMAASGPSSAMTTNAYAGPTTTVQTSQGETVEVGVTGTYGIAPIAQIRGARPRGLPKPSITQAEAVRQISVLNQAILRDDMIQPGQIAVGQVVSQKLKFKKGEDRTLYLKVRIAGDEHSFKVAAPSD